MLTPLGRKERRRWGGVYLRGLLLEGDRKSAGAMAARLPDGNEQNLQQFLSQSPWDWLPLWQQTAERVERTSPRRGPGSLATPSVRKKGGPRWGCPASTRAHWARRRIARSL